MNPMNQNTTAETIREAIGKLDKLFPQEYWARTAELRRDFVALANRLEAAPQPPVEQNEPTHPLHAGYVIIDGEKRELRQQRMKELLGQPKVSVCPYCDYEPIATDCRACHATLEAIGDNYLWLAPAAVIEPEPELDEFEKWLDENANNAEFSNGRHLRGVVRVESALEKYREIVTRKGDK